MAGLAENRWRALRALYESGAVPELLGAASGLLAATIAGRALREGWRTPDSASAAAERAGRLSGQIGWLIGEIDAIRKDTEDGAPLDKARVEAVSAMTRTLEKIGEIMRLEDGANNNKTERDADMAEVLGRIDARIVELARAYAERLVAAEFERRQDGADQR